MTLDLVLIRPEFFLLFGFLVLLRYGTGGLVTPVIEMVTVLEGPKNISRKSLWQMPNAGPNHAASALCWWAICWCLLGARLLFFTPMSSLYLGGNFQKDRYSLQLSGILLTTAALVLRVAVGWQKVAAISHTEYVYLAMLAIMGQHMLLQTSDLIAMYLCLELQSFSLVVLCGLNYKSAYSIEAAMKYFLLSAFRSCLLLLGIGFIYWQTGETTLFHLENLVLRTQSEPSLLLLLGIWLVTIGLLWKLAAAPLHFWVPDVYTGAWSSVSLWITVLPKIAVLGFWTHHWHTIWARCFGNTLSFFRILSLVIGAFAPLAQTSLKRLLAYSSIGHMGLLLMPLCRSSLNSLSAMWTHMFIYVLINLGVWGLLMWPMIRPHDPSTKVAGPQYIWDLKGLNQSSATAAFRWAIFMASLRGLPPVYGFLGKAAILWTSLNQQLVIPVVFALIATLVGSIYYLKVMKVCYVDNPANWGSYEKLCNVSAYIIARCATIILLGLWHGNVLLLLTHLLALKV